MKNGKAEHLIWEQGGDFDEATYRRVLGEVRDAAEETDRSFLLIGGLASSLYGRDRTTHDIDLLVKGADADLFLGGLESRSFESQRTYPDWLYKGLKEGVLVDVIFRSAGNIFLDDEMVNRARVAEVHGIDFPLVSPEDLVVIKALAHKENSPRHLHDVAAVVSRQNIDWPYLSWRARLGAKRVLSFLMFARSEGVDVPSEVITEMVERIYGS
jgi:predicted nucleotidyltransferase